MLAERMNRRALLAGLVSLIAAPAIVRASSLMPVHAWKEEPEILRFTVKFAIDKAENIETDILEMTGLERSWKWVRNGNGNGGDFLIPTTFQMEARP